ncbi:MAG TPA: MFS transporter [Actinocatenispora sp.]
MDTASAAAVATRPAGTRAPAATTAVTCAATLIALMNYTAPMTVLGPTGRSLGAGLAGQTWILNGISVGLAAVLLTAGSLADAYGRRRVFLVGALLLAVTSAWAALAGSTVSFVLARAGQGAATAALIAAGLGLIARAYQEPGARRQATAVWSAMLGAGIALGPVASAAVTRLADWRWYYAATALAALGLAAAGALVLGESAGGTRRVDVAGALTLTAGVVCLLAALTLGRTGWVRPGVLALAVAAVVFLLLFGVAEARGRAPMLDLRLLRTPGFVAATVGALLTGAAVVGVMSYLPTVLQHGLGLRPLATAWLFAAWSGTAFAVSLGARRLRVRPRHQLAAGLLLSAVGDLAVLALLQRGTPALLPGLVVAGVGSGLLNTALARLAVETVPPHAAAMGSGANNTARYIGSSLGVTIVVAVAAVAHATGVLVLGAALAAAGSVLLLALHD